MKPQTGISIDKLLALGIVTFVFATSTAHQAYARGGYWKAAGNKPYSVTFSDEAKNTVMGEFKKTVRWERDAKGKVTVTMWDDQATFVLKNKNGKDHKISNDLLKKRILDLDPGYTGKLRGNITDIVEAQTKPTKAAVKTQTARVAPDVAKINLEDKKEEEAWSRAIQRDDPSEYLAFYKQYPSSKRITVLAGTLTTSDHFVLNNVSDWVLEFTVEGAQSGTASVSPRQAGRLGLLGNYGEAGGNAFAIPAQKVIPNAIVLLSRDAESVRVLAVSSDSSQQK